MSDRPILLLFYRDLRVSDHPALTAAVETGRPVVPVYIHDEKAAGDWAPGGASRWWLHHSLARLNDDLEAKGNRLTLRAGATVDCLRALCEETHADAIYVTRGFEPWVRDLETAIREAFQASAIEVKRFRGRLLIDPDAIRTKSGDVYKVYTPFWRALRERGVPAPLPAPSAIKAPKTEPQSDTLESWGLLPTKPDWADGLVATWTPGRAGAVARLNEFLDGPVDAYDEMRNRPDRHGTSRLSPHFQFGEMSPLEAFAAGDHRFACGADGPGGSGPGGSGPETFLKELVWREFSYHLLYHFPHLPVAPFKRQFEDFPWRDDGDALQAWQRGQTGYPIVDAGMRQLWHTGWMHNRVRMIVGSFLTKNLLLPWQLGERWFWDTLVDADLASNSASWQWVSGSGADAAPYFRIFNPITQSERFDPEGDYIRRWVPQLAKLDAKSIHAPWEAAPMVLRAADITLGKSYPQPIVDHKATRQRALDAYACIKSKAS